MTHLERWRRTLARQPVDRPPVFFAGTPEFIAELEQWTGLDLDTVLHEAFDCGYRHVHHDMDFKVLEPRYAGPPPIRNPDGTLTNLWGVRQRAQDYGKGRYIESVGFPLAEASTVAAVERHHWPSPDWYDYESILGPLERYPDYPFMIGYLAIGWFAWETRGMSQFLLDLYDKPAIVEAIVERVAEFGEVYFKRILETARDHIGRNFVCIHLADDWATQQGPLIAPELYRQFFKPHYRRIVDMAHAAGLKVEFHCCGGSVSLMPEFIDTGFDMLNPVQTSAAGMDPAVLKARFGQKVAFSGGIDVQQVLPLGSPGSVAKRVHRLLDVLGAGGGYMPGPSHNIQVGTPPENVVSAYAAIYEHYGVANPMLRVLARRAHSGRTVP